MEVLCYKRTHTRQSNIVKIYNVVKYFITESLINKIKKSQFLQLKEQKMDKRVSS